MATKKSNKVKGFSGWPCGLALPDDVLVAARLFNQAYNKYKEYGARIPKVSQLTNSQAEVLMSLAYMQRPMTLTEISPFLPIETASVSLVIDKLQKQKLVQRRHSRTDRRNIFISLTPKGKRVIDALWPAIHTIIMDMFCNNLTEQERRLFSSVLRKIRDTEMRPLPAKMIAKEDNP